MNSSIAERRIMTALTRDIPPAADRTYKLGEEVLVYNEYKKEWLGPLIVVDSTGRMITAYNPQTKLRQPYNTHQVKPFYRDINNNMKELKSKNDHGPPPYTLHITEVIEPNDSRAWKFDEPIKKEIEGLIKRKTWKIVCRSEVPDFANILGGIFVLEINDEGTNREIWKATDLLYKDIEMD